MEGKTLIFLGMKENFVSKNIKFLLAVQMFHLGKWMFLTQNILKYFIVIRKFKVENYNILI
jgi:hypothetical protein